jgi:PQQ-dependent dehydrogenase (methanol/ethanol family)
MLIYTDVNQVLALDARNGNRLWRFSRKPGPAALCCSLVNRGVAVYGDRVFVGTIDGHVLALNRQDGTLAWDRVVAQSSQGYSFTMAPLVADGKVLIGTSGGEFGIRGFLEALDPGDGRRLWRFWIIPSPQEGGWWGKWSPTTTEGDSLPRDIAQEKRDSARYAEAWRHGGGGIYTTPAYDPKLKLLIFGTGNPSPMEDVYPPGDNLYTSSVVAVDISTGKLRWFHQLIPHNIWDFDVATPPVLFDQSRGGNTVPAVGQAAKTGWVYILDRRTGAPLLRSDPLMPLENIFPSPTPESLHVRSSPGTRGGANWPPAAYSPQTGLLYVMASYYPMAFIIKTEGKKKRGGTKPIAGMFKKLSSPRHFGTLSAIDVGTGKLAWQDKIQTSLMYGGVLTTAAGLVFLAEPTGYVDALDASTGKSLWRYRVKDSQLGPPVSFEVDGEQRIAVTTPKGVVAFGLK